MFAVIHNEKVVQRFNKKKKLSINVVEIPKFLKNEKIVGWSYKDDRFSPPFISDFKKEIKKRLNDKRKEYESAGFYFGQLHIRTKQTVLDRIIRAIDALERSELVDASGNETNKIDEWLLDDYGFTEVSLEQLKAVRVAINRHTQQTFRTQKEITLLIDAISDDDESAVEKLLAIDFDSFKWSLTKEEINTIANSAQ